MLYIGYGCPDDIYFNIDLEFELLFEMKWLDDKIVQKIMNDIDNCYWNGTALVDKDDGYVFPLHGISSGAKALIMCQCLDEDPIPMWGPAFGDNCLDLLLTISEYKNVEVYLENFLKFSRDKFKGYSLKQNRMYVDYWDYFSELSLEVPNWK